MLKDLALATRNLTVRPAFSLLALLTIALGIGVNTAMFTVVNGVLWKPYPYPEADRLVRLFEDSPSGGLNNSAPNTADWKARSQVLENIAVYRFFPGLTLRLPGGEQRAVVAYAQPSLFPVLRVTPMKGRLFGEADAHPGAEARAVITFGAWEKYFGKNPGVVGKPVPVSTSGTASIVISGILPKGFEYDDVEVWLPLGRFPLAPDSMRANHWFASIARLNPNVTPERAGRELAAVSIALEQQYPDSNKGIRPVLQTLSDFYARRVKTSLLVLFWAVAFVMLIACGNVVHLVLTRTISRSREIAVRLALGSGAGRLVRLLLSEGLLLSIGGAVLGVVAAQWLVTLAVRAQPDLLPRAEEVRVDPQSLLYAFGAAILTAVLLSTIPVLRVGRTNLLDALKDVSGRGSAGRRRQRLGWILIAGEIALASVLLAGAGLMIQTLRNLSKVDFGYDPNGLLSVNFATPAGKQYTEQSSQALIDRIQDAARTLPGYQASALASPFAVGGNGMLGPVIIPGKTNPSTPPLVPAMRVTPDFFDTMRIPIRRGRGFSRVQSKIPEIIVNEEFVRRFLKDENPLNRRVSVWDPADIVGVVGNSRLQGSLTEPKPEVYFSGVDASEGPTLLVRFEGRPESVGSALQERVRSTEPGLRVGAPRTLVSREEARIALEKFTRGLLSAFAILATLLACLGIYGVAGYSVAQRMREIGIRLALGATRANIARLVLMQTLVATSAGIIAGLAGAAILGRFIRSQLYGVTPYDPAMVGLVAFTLAVVTLVATAAPIRRASRVDAVVSLRQE